MGAKFLIIVGLISIVAGAVLLFTGYSSNDAAIAAIAWVAIIGGALALLGGISRQVGQFMGQKPNENSEYGHAEIRALIKSMGEMAAADGTIDPREIDTIADIHKRMLGLSISPKEVGKILSEFNADDDVHKILRDDSHMINPAMKRMIIQSCYLVMIADGDKASVELARLHEIGDALGLSQTEVDHLISIAQT